MIGIYIDKTVKMQNPSFFLLFAFCLDYFVENNPFLCQLFFTHKIVSTTEVRVLSKR